MAKKKKKPVKQTTTSIETNSFIKGMSKDLSASFQNKQTWHHAINAYNNSIDGDVGTIGNEPANLKCGEVPYTIIGTIHKQGDEWVIYSTDDANSEIGLYDDGKCEYKTLVNAQCLNFNRKNLITGATKENYDCTWQVYWDDNLNPSRTLNLDDIPYKQIQTSLPGDPCVVFEDTDELDCEKLRLAPLVDVPCIKLTKSSSGGQLRNGSYQAYIAYTENSQVVTDYIGISNIQSLFNHEELSTSLDIEITNLDQDFEEFKLVILSNNNQQTVAKEIGIYSTATSSISIDFIDPALPSLSLQVLFKRSPAYEKSESMYVVNDYLIRQGPTEQFDFNYQPLANQINTEWVVAEYPGNYYYKGGNKTGFMRDEQYAFFIRFIYNTGERSFSYHIPGRAAKLYPPQNVFEDQVINGSNVLNPTDGEYLFNVYNTASVTPPFNLSIPTEDGGTIIAKGEMGYWQSTETYPNKPDIWNASSNPIWGSTLPSHDLCGKPIRHHKMPSVNTDVRVELNNKNNGGDGSKIRILGVQFNNIKRPLFNDGTPIPNIVGYEILRSSREGAKSILAKGIFRNMREYEIPEDTNSSNKIGLYPNYPYNSLEPDYFFHNGKGITGIQTTGIKNFAAWKDNITAPPLQDYRRDVFTFHSPEMMFRRPFLNAYEAKFYGKVKGLSDGYFIKSEQHPQYKLLHNVSVILASVVGLGYALGQMTGKVNKQFLPVQGIHLGKLQAGYSLRFIEGSVVPPSGIDIPDVEQPNTDPLNINPLNPSQPASNAGNINLTNTIINGAINTIEEPNLGVLIASIISGGKIYEDSFNLLSGASGYANVLKTTPGTMGGGTLFEFENTKFTNLPGLVRTAFSIPGFFMFVTEGANEIIELFYNISAFRDYAIKHNSEGFYDTFENLNTDTTFRSRVLDSNFLGSTYQRFGDENQFKINNLFRPDTLAVHINDNIQEPFVGEDDSRYTLGQIGDILNITDTQDLKNLFTLVFGGTNKRFQTDICSLYGALKFDFENQYGQLEGIKQVPMRGCIESIDPTLPSYVVFKTQPIFSGDIYVNRFTEKTIMPIFSDFLYNQPDGFVFNYLQYQNIPYPRYWMNTTKYDFTQLFQGLGTFFNIFNPGSGGYNNFVPTDLFCLDAPFTVGQNIDPVSFLNYLQSTYQVINAFMYTHVNGVQDFFVESEINLAQRDWDDAPEKRHYDIYTYNNVNDLFDAAIIKKDNFYKYDVSLSASRFVTNLSTYGTVQPRDYDPLVAEQCFTSYPKRLVYSLRAQEEAKKDFWRVFLPNNYKDFKDKVSVIKPINQTGALMFFPYRSPKVFQGVDQLQTDLGTKIVLGDGGLFAREPQNIINSDLANEYGSCESARSVINTPSGVYFISQAQGKIFNYAGKMNAISNNGMKWWFNKYLPSVLLRQYPELEETELADNPVVGIGCQSVYDVNNDVVYFMKKDFAVKEIYQKLVTFDVDKLQFYFQIGINPKTDDPLTIPIELGDDRYFDNASWTVSYDPKIKGWVSFHDWHPELSLPSINHFLTTKTQPTDEPYCPPGYYYNQQTNECEKLIEEAAPATVNIITQDSEDCECEDGFTLVYANPNDGFQYNTTTNPNADPNDCIVVDTQTTIINGNSQGTSTCDCMKYLLTASWLSGANNFITIRYLDCSGSYQDITLSGNSQNETICARPFVQPPGPPLSPVDSTGTFAFLSGNSALFNQIVTSAQGVCGNGYPCCKCFITTISNNNELTALKYSYVNCDGDVIQDQILPANETNFLLGCIRENSVTVTDLSGNIAPPSTFTINLIEECGTYPCGPTTIVTTIEYPPICQQVDCFCPDGPAGTTVTQIGDCPTLGDVLSGNDTPPLCQYFSDDTTTPSFVRGGIWRHNYRCDLYANYYGVDYPWEIEFVENTGQMVNTVRSVEYQLESYVYKGDLINGCGDDRWHDLDFNFDEAIISNSEQVSGLLRLDLSPKNDPAGILKYPIINPFDIRILYSKEEQKYRFNQFWDITNDRGEYSNAEQRIFETQINGYIKNLNLNNLDYDKPSFQHKKFRHYYNKVMLRRRLSNDRKMLLKLNNTKLNLSYR